MRHIVNSVKIRADFFFSLQQMSLTNVFRAKDFLLHKFLLQAGYFLNMPYFLVHFPALLPQIIAQRYRCCCL